MPPVSICNAEDINGGTLPREYLPRTVPYCQAMQPSWMAIAPMTKRLSNALPARAV